MIWVRIDDAAPHHPKLLAAGPESAWLWAAGLAYSNRQTTDGVIAREVLHALYPHASWTARKLERLVAELVRVKLWELHESGWLIHDYGEYQEPALRESVESRREAAREKKRLQRDRQRQSPDGRPSKQFGAAVPCVSPRTGPGRSPGDKARDSTGDGSGDPMRDATGDISETHSRQPGVSRPPVPPRPVPPLPYPPDAEGSGCPRREDERPDSPSPESTQVLAFIDTLRRICPDTILFGGADTLPIRNAIEERLKELSGGMVNSEAQFEILGSWYAAGAMAWRSTPLGIREISSKHGLLADHIDRAIRWDRDGRPAIPEDRMSQKSTFPALKSRRLGAEDPLIAKARLRRK